MEGMSSKRSRNKPRPVAASGRAVPRPTVRPARPTPPPAAPREESQGNPNLVLGVVIAVALFLAWYYHLLALGQMKDLVGLPMLDHRPFGYDSAEVDALRHAMDPAARGQLSWVHKTAGTLFTLFAAGATALAVGLHGPRTAWRRVLYAFPAALIPVEIAQNVMVDELLGRADDGLLPATAALTVAGWILLLGCLLVTVVVLASAFVREFLRRWRDPSLQEPTRR